jgi:hypothetical protein
MKRRSFLQGLLAIGPLLPSKTLYADIDKADKFAEEHNILYSPSDNFNDEGDWGIHKDRLYQFGESTTEKEGTAFNRSFKDELRPSVYNFWHKVNK